MPRASSSRASDTARLDAELLMAEALHIDRDRLILSPPDREVPERFWAMVERRKAGEPVAYITGRRAFWNIELHVGPGVLVPRPDFGGADRLGDRAFRRHRRARRGSSTSAPGPGPCCSPRSTSGPTRPGLASTCRASALSYASANARRLGFEPRVTFRLGNWADGLEETLRSDPVQPALCRRRAPSLAPGCANIEPDEALFAGDEGLDAYRALAPQLPRLLDQGGLAAVEIGHDQAAAVTALLARDGLQATVAKDLAGRDRGDIC